MKSLGIVRCIDQLGRIVLPKELRKTLDLKEKEPMEIFMEGNRIILSKYEGNTCTFCNSSEDVSQFKGKNVCFSCLGELNSKIS
jgi:transcriptional pleiotropic regulator of transition state genes